MKPHSINTQKADTNSRSGKPYRLSIKNGELIPVDAVIVEGRGYLDYSFVTGEEDLTTKGVGDKVFAGGKLNTGSLELEVLRRVEHS